MLGFGCTAVKYLLWIVNFLIFVAGLAILAFGVWIYVDPSSFLFAIQKLPVDNYQLEAWTQSQVLREGMYAIIGLGGFLLVLGFLGCCGASRENRCFLLLYGIIVLLVALALAIGTGIFFGFKDQLIAEARDAMEKNLLKDYKYSPVVNKTNIATNVLNLVMMELRCCGVNNYTDFRNKVKDWPADRSVPPACCKLQDTDDSTILPSDPLCTTSPSPRNANIDSGCYDRMAKLIRDNMIIVLGTIVGVIILLLIDAMFAFLLFHEINRQAAVKPI